MSNTKEVGFFEGIFGLLGAIAVLGIGLFLLSSVVMFVLKIFSWIWS
jgi:hypothetical protein